MKAAVLHGIRDIRIEDIPRPRCAAGEVLVRVRAVGVCGSDVHYYKKMRIGDQIVEDTIVPGHEFAGLLEEVGEGVTSVAVGDRVAVEPGVPCRVCRECREGFYNRCRNMRFCGTPPQNGAYLEYYVSPSDFVFKLPENFSFEEGSMIEPLSVGVHGVRLAAVKNGDVIAIFGAGPIGLCTLQCAKHAGAFKVFVTDPLEYRLEFAKRFGADVIINPEKEDVVERIMSQTGGRGVDIVFEASGADEPPQQALDIAAPGGKVMWIGIPGEAPVPLDTHDARRKELQIKFVRRFCHDYPTAIELAASGRVDVKSMVTHTFPLDKIEDAFKIVEDYADGVIRAVIRI